MSQRLSHRDLRNRSAEILRDVRAGATFEVTHHGVVVAVLSPPVGRTELRIRPARVHRGFGELSRTRPTLSSEHVLDELRADR
ncbi:MAG TPA: type II toxin-antitoxin system prevent-host-death family antitoxin [Microlunatus sp.]